MTINNEHKKLNVPNLRFKEFQGEWEKCKLGDITTNFNVRNKEKIQYPMYSVTNNRGFVPQTEQFEDRDMVGEDIKAYKVIHKDEFAYNPARINVGSIARYEGDKPCMISSLYVCFKSRRQIDSNWLMHLLKTPKMNFYYNINGEGGVRVYLFYPNFARICTSYPGVEEQKKIAKLLSLLDERISTQNKIIDKLQSLIKGLEDNLLDNPLWEKTYLRSFMQFFPTNSLSWEQLSYKEGAIRNLHYGLIHSFQTRGINSASLPMIKNEAVPKQYILCQVGDVAFADASEDTGEIAKSVEFVDTIEGDTICGLHTIHGRDIKNRTVVGFKGFAFNSRYFHNQIKRLAQGTKVFSITANNLSSCYVYLPDLEKQKAIVKLLRSYEEQLIIGRMILKQYEKQKQYLLRQMFI